MAETTTRGRARRRQQLRSRRRMQRTQNAGQLAPTGRIRLHLPRVRIPYGQLVVGVIFGVGLLLAVVFLLRELKPAEAEILPNALWIGTDWTYAERTPAELRQLASHLRAHEIGTVYAWVSWLQGDRTWRGTENFARVRAFAQQLKEIWPGLELHGWISLPSVPAGIGYRLNDPEVQQGVVDFSSSVVRELGFDGVFLNIEPVWDGDAHFLELLRRVRLRLGEEVPISVAIPPDWSPASAPVTGLPVPPLVTPGTEWSRDYKKNVALLSDQMAIMSYNSGLSDAADYEEWMAWQVSAYAGAVSELGEGTELLIGIPTYGPELPAHDPAVENVVSALNGYRAGLEAAGAAAAWVRGLAIFADYETDAAEWEQFRLLAVGG